MEKGLLTDIQRFSLNDGPGIRTTVFFKGCNLHCAWCHNPETIRSSNELLVHPEKCIGCGHCISACPEGALKKEGTELRWDRRLCTQCGRCAEICFPGAREMAGRLYSVAEVMHQIVQDKAYYADSHGGVTLSGGEVFCQAQFAEKLIDACHAEKIFVAAETNLLFDFPAMEPVLRKLDLVLFDLKLFDPALHEKWTGAGNAKILENARKLDALDLPLIARTPLIPGATATEENVSAIAGFLKDFRHLQCYELLNFNPLGADKYRSLLKENPFRDARPLSAKELETLRQAASSSVNARIG